MDHIAGLPYYFAQRDFQGITGGTALVPADLVAPLENLFAAMAKGGDFGPEEIKWFNGGLFDNTDVIPLNSSTHNSRHGHS